MSGQVLIPQGTPEQLRARLAQLDTARGELVADKKKTEEAVAKLQVRVQARRDSLRCTGMHPAEANQRASDAYAAERADLLAQARAVDSKLAALNIERRAINTQLNTVAPHARGRDHDAATGSDELSDDYDVELATYAVGDAEALRAALVAIEQRLHDGDDVTAMATVSATLIVVWRTEA